MKKHHDAPTKVSSLKVMAAIQSQVNFLDFLDFLKIEKIKINIDNNFFVTIFQDEKAAAAKRPTLTGVSSSSSSTKPTTQGNFFRGIVNCLGVARSVV